MVCSLDMIITIPSVISLPVLCKMRSRRKSNHNSRQLEFTSSDIVVFGYQPSNLFIHNLVFHCFVNFGHDSLLSIDYEEDI